MHDKGTPLSAQYTCSRQVHVEKELAKHKLHFKRITLLYDVPWLLQFFVKVAGQVFFKAARFLVLFLVALVTLGRRPSNL